MVFEENDVVKLTRDIAEHGLQKGDIGAIVLVYAPKQKQYYEIEFLRNGDNGRPISEAICEDDLILDAKGTDFV